MSAMSSAFARVFLDEEDRTAQIPELGDCTEYHVGCERGEAERGLVGDEHLGGIGQRGSEAQHLLLTTGQRTGDLPASLAQHSGTARRRSGVPAVSGATG